MEGVRQLLAPFCSDIRVLVYLRPQDEMALSAYGMMVKEGRADVVALPSFAETAAPQRAMGWGYFDYAALLARWAAEFGQAAIMPRRFTRTALVGGDVIDDLLATLGVSGDGLVRPARWNTNIEASAQRLLAGVNRVLVGRSEADVARVRSWMVPRLAPGGGVLPARAAVLAFMAQFKDVNEAVRAAWFPGLATLFAEDLGHYPETEAAAAPPEMCELLVRMILADP